MSVMNLNNITQRTTVQHAHSTLVSPFFEYVLGGCNIRKDAKRDIQD